MNADFEPAERSKQRQLLAEGQSQLSQALDRAMLSLRTPGSSQVARYLVDLSVILRKHKHLVSHIASIRPDDEAAATYLDLINRLRRDVNTRMSLLATGVQESLLSDEFETLGWETLARGVLWLDSLHQASHSAPQPLSQVGAHWAKARGDADPDQLAAAMQQEIDEEEAIDIDQMLYCSLASAPMTEAELDALAQNAERLNRMDHISGMLMYGDGVFIQLIEGPREAINGLWARLLKDKRHYGVVQLYHRRELESRTCKGWGMQYVEREQLSAIIHEAKEEIVQGRKTAWAPAIERMDFLLSQTQWSSMTSQLTSQAASTHA
jgi:hypothetical protein